MKRIFSRLIALFLLFCIIISAASCRNIPEETTTDVVNQETSENIENTTNANSAEVSENSETTNANEGSASSAINETSEITEITESESITEIDKITETSEDTATATEEITSDITEETIKEYSKNSNSGIRDEICTTLKGTGAQDYYGDQYSFDILAALSSHELKVYLNELMTSTHTYMSSYKDCKESYTITDCQQNDTSLFIALYTSYATRYDQFNSGNGWNREHVWPKSLGGFDNSGAGSDLHHIRPTENRTNSVRGNLKYGNAANGSETTGNLSGLLGGYKGTYYEPLDNVKGDVARIILYVHVRYYNVYSQCSKIENVFESIDVLLEWCALDPVDTWEMGRNEVVENIQGNRNVFIDYPELAWLLFGREIPDNLVTPSSTK